MNRNNKNNKKQTGKYLGQDSYPFSGPKAYFIKPTAVKAATRYAKELNYVDIPDAAYVIDTTGSVTLLNGIAEGDDNSARNGRLATMKSVAIAGFAKATVTTGLLQEGRVMLVWDSAPNGALATLTSILETASSLSFPAVNGENRFTILWDHKFVLDYNGAATSKSIHDFMTHIALNTNTKFNGTAGTIGSIAEGALLLVTVGSNAAGTTAGTATINSRVRFVEK